MQSVAWQPRVQHEGEGICGDSQQPAPSALKTHPLADCCPPLVHPHSPLPRFLVLQAAVWGNILSRASQPIMQGVYWANGSTDNLAALNGRGHFALITVFSSPCSAPCTTPASLLTSDFPAGKGVRKAGLKGMYIKIQKRFLFSVGNRDKPRHLFQVRRKMPDGPEI